LLNNYYLIYVRENAFFLQHVLVIQTTITVEDASKVIFFTIRLSVVETIAASILKTIYMAAEVDGLDEMVEQA
jgi:hypothetical protein